MARPRCARHPTARVWLDGTYGSNGRRRQRFKCVSADGSTHVFTEPLPRHRTRRGECDECERHLARYEGVPSPRRCFYAAREIAATLARLGEGMSYRRAGREARLRAERLKVIGANLKVPSTDSAVVEDWVEVFAPVVAAPSQPTEWPPLLELDEHPIFIRSRAKPGPAGKTCVFRIFGALGWDEAGRRLVYRLEAFPDKSPTSWRRFLASIPGRPAAIVCDNESGMLKGIAQLWPETLLEPEPIILLSHWHLRHALEKLFKRYKFTGSQLDDDLVSAFTSASCWATFVAGSHTATFPALHRWLARETYCWWLGGKVTMEERVAWQLALPHKDVPKSNSAIEQTLRNVSHHFKHRQFAFRNRERTNRLLELMRLHENGHASEPAYARLIRKHLLANGGHGDPRGLIVDPKGTYSLWQ